MASAPYSASMPPPDYNSTEKADELRMSPDRHFALHGEIMMLILVLLFLGFLFILLIFLSKKKKQRSRAHDRSQHGSFGQVSRSNVLLPMVQFKAHTQNESKLQQHQQEFTATHQSA